MCFKNKSVTQIFFELRAFVWILALLFLVVMIISSLTACNKPKVPETTIGLRDPFNGQPIEEEKLFPMPMYCYISDNLQLDCFPPILEPHIKNAEEMNREWEDEDIEREDDQYYGKEGEAREARREERQNGDRSRIAFLHHLYC